MCIRDSIWYNAREGEVIHPNTKKPVAPRFLDGTTPEIGDRDRREVLAEWILGEQKMQFAPVSYTHLRAHETVLDLVCRLLLEKKKNNTSKET